MDLGHWDRDGYQIIPNLINHSKIDELLYVYENQVLRSTDELLRQNGRFEPHNLSLDGGLRNTLLDPHCYWKSGLDSYRAFGIALMNIFGDPYLLQSMSSISGSPSKFLLAQSMFFDQVTTRAHQDCIYLDTIPSGSLVACWIALQDLDETHTKFYVLPGSHCEHLQEKSDSDAYFDSLSQLIENKNYTTYSPCLKKGDVLFWHSRTIHGSRHGSKPDSRRLSITGHFIPEGSTYGKDSGPITGKKIETYRGLSYYTNTLVDASLAG